MVRCIARWLVIAVLVIGYPLLAHYTNESAYRGHLGALVAITPVVLIALILAWRSPRRLLMLGVLALLCAALWAWWPALEHHFGVIYWLQHAGIQLMLCIIFARTLVAGRQPLCTRFAEAVHAPLTSRHEIYARQVTVAWTLFFAAMVLVSTALFFLAPLASWSVFANFMTLPLVVLMFMVEYLVRRRVLPNLRHTHILDAVRAFRNTPLIPR
ncbi:MAG: hypothetical protein EHM16_08545 [Betaproteobacteria bacterium]|nr:MAG: hypothetical protein EHM16_08545 [Betaproteobacteria bacterium]